MSSTARPTAAKIPESDRASRGTLRNRRREFGRSALGTPLEVFLPESSAPKLLILAGQHGDEPETVSLLSSALRSIPEPSLSAAVVLAANPDGIIRGTRGNARGVDLNRNFPVPNWGTGEIVYRWTSKCPRDVTLSAGEAAGSEPETAAIVSLVEELKPEYILSIHAPLACVDDPDASPLGMWLAEKTGLGLVPDVGYATPGSFGTWAKARAQKLITWELPHLALEELRIRFDPILMRLLTGRWEPELAEYENTEE